MPLPLSTIFVVLVLQWGLRNGAAEKDLGGGWKEKKNNEGKVVQELKIEAPAMTEEDQYGYTMPDRYRCDSCKAVMFHLDQELRKKHPKSRRMKSWEYNEVLEETCKGGVQGYGIKLLNGQNTLSGPGLPQAQELAPGSGAIQMGGETWSKRLGEICRRIVFEQVGEEEVYDMFYKGLRSPESGSDGSALGLTEGLCIEELKECVTEPLGPLPPPKAEKKAEKAKAKKEKGKNKAQASTAAAAKPRPPPAEKLAASTAASNEAKPTDDKMDVQAFLRTLAVRHGLTSDEYLASRSMAEWERLTVAIAGRIFNRLATSEADESCRAGGFGSV